MSKDLSREYLKVARIHKELIWLSYDPDYKEIDLKSAIEIVGTLKEKIKKELNN